MYDLKEAKGTFKGTIGECMFKLTNERVVITKFFNQNKYFFVFGKYFNEKQLKFLQENWYSLDAIEINFAQGKQQIFLYEIKTRNKYRRELGYKPKMTEASHILYNQSRDYGFIPKLVTVWLYDNWNYDLNIEDFHEELYCIDKPKKYDRVANF
ncbi:MAG: hypothetical protein AABX05_04725 [Nanoarchaeota archaeon]